MGSLHAALVLCSLVSITLAADQIVFAQSLWRHGDRTPTGTYKNDPYQEDFWGMPWGELTTRGMKQQFLQGQRLKKMYIDQYKLLGPKYTREEITINSATTPRCIQSALSNMAGFFLGSPTAPTDVQGWPKNWAPVPIHNIPSDEDRVNEPGTNCDRATELLAERVAKKNFLDFVASHWNIFAEIMAHGGDTVALEFDTLRHFYGAVSIEKKYYNLTLPDWITDDLYNQLEGAIAEALDYVTGSAGFGYDEETELVRLQGGFLLKEWIGNLQAAVAGKTTSYIAYSAHDSTIVALLHTLQAKFATIDKGNPEYAATVVCELWKRDDGQFYVKMMYADDAYTELRPITRNIKGCPPDSDFCGIQSFIDRSANYIPKSDRDCNPFA